MALVKLQMGKNGLTNEFIENLKHIFEKNEHVRISLLKSSTRDKEEVRGWSVKMLEALGKNYTCKVIGYTIVLRKWRKARTTE